MEKITINKSQINYFTGRTDDIFEFKTSVQIKAALKEFKDKNFAEKYIK